jgi:hypothetical protein
MAANERLPQLPQGPVFSIDVECVATGNDHNSRDVAQISLVDQQERVRCGWGKRCRSLLRTYACTHPPTHSP